MRPSFFICAVGITMSVLVGPGQSGADRRVLQPAKTVKVGGAGTFDTAFADVGARRLVHPA